MSTNRTQAEIVSMLEMAIYRDAILTGVDVESMDLSAFDKTAFLENVPVNLPVTTWTAYGHLATNLETLSQLTHGTGGN